MKNIARAVVSFPFFLGAISLASAQTDSDQASALFVEAPETGLMNDGGVSRGVAWGDFDNDGFPDLAVANTDDGVVFLYRNIEGDRFERVTDTSVGQTEGRAQGVSWVDINNDGWLDLFVTTEEAPNRLFLNDAGAFVQIDAGPLTASATASTQACWADIDNDRLLDVYVVNADYQDDALYRNIDGRMFEPVTGPWQGKENHGRSCAFADPNNDGNPDLYVANAYFEIGEERQYAPNFFFRNDGDNAFTEITHGEFVNATGYSYGVSWFDIDADGDEDLFVSNISRYAPNKLYENAGDNQYFPVWASPIMRDVPGPPKGHVWADFDNDGDTDLLLVEGHGGARPHHAPFDNVNRYYENRDGVFHPVDAGALTGAPRVSAGGAGADIDRDGDIDVFAANWSGDDVNNQFFRNDSSGNWISLQLEGVVSNRQGVGAKVKTTTGEGDTAKTQIKSLWLNMGYASMSEPVMHFGLGNENKTQTIEITWPSGAVDRHENVAGGRRYLVIEGGSMTAIE